MTLWERVFCDALNRRDLDGNVVRNINDAIWLADKAQEAAANHQKAAYQKDQMRFNQHAFELGNPFEYRGHVLTPKSDESGGFYCDVDGDQGLGSPIDGTIEEAVRFGKMVVDDKISISEVRE